jgi:hypothetical protein
MLWGTPRSAAGSDNGQYVTSAGRICIAARANLDQHHLDAVLGNMWLTLRSIVLSVLKLLEHFASFQRIDVLR